MEIEMVFNELSALPQPITNNIHTARQWMSTFIQTTVSATAKFKVKRVLRFEPEFFNMLLAPDYSLSIWLNDKQVDREEKRRWTSLQTKYPILVGFEETKTENQYLLSNFSYQGNPVYGLGIAYLLDALALSINSDQQWDTCQLAIQTPQTVIVHHASQPNHLQENSNWIEEHLRQSVCDGTDLWNRRQELFPNLVFCQSVEKQLRVLQSGNPLLHPVVKQLFEFERYCQDWTDNKFDKTKILGHCSGESESTLNKYGETRTFLCPDGQWRLFELHAKLGLNAWRIHFLPQPESHTIIIGYIGSHLLTATG